MLTLNLSKNHRKKTELGDSVNAKGGANVDVLCSILTSSHVPQVLGNQTKREKKEKKENNKKRKQETERERERGNKGGREAEKKTFRLTAALAHATIAAEWPPRTRRHPATCIHTWVHVC